MSHVLHTVIVSYNRLPLLKRTLRSYVDTVTLPYTLTVVDNGSDKSIVNYLKAWNGSVVLLPDNMYPGFASNEGFRLIQPGTTLLHRSDNDIEYLPGWCDEVLERFTANPLLGQLGLRTLEEEGAHQAVGGNSVLRRELWDQGLRYGEEPWSKVPFEDAVLSQKVARMGWQWGRAHRPCVRHIGLAHKDDPYYQRTFADRGITFEQYGLA